MFLSFISTTLLSLGFLVVAEPQLSPYILHEKRTHIPAGWSHVRKHDPFAVLPLRFALSQSNIHNLEDFLNDISHPDSPNYGNHWTPSQIAKTFAPNDETVDAVWGWLSGSGFAANRLRVTPTKGWIEVNATVEEAERLLQAEYHVYAHGSGKEHIGA
jgi:tripeptidyl-peptidase-1